MLREAYKGFLYSSLLILSFISLSIALDSLGDVPELIALPPPPFVDSYKGLKPPGLGQGVERGTKIVVDATCGCPDDLTLNITGVTGSEYLRMRIGDVYNGSWTLGETVTELYFQGIWLKVPAELFVWAFIGGKANTMPSL